MSLPLAKTIAALVSQGQYIVGIHASERLEQRGILEWQVIVAMEHGTFLSEDSAAKPNAVAAFEIVLPDGTAAKAVWSHLPRASVAKLVTVHYFDEA